MAAPMNCGESDMVTEDFRLNLSPLLSPRWSQLCLTPSPPLPFLPSSSSMVMQYQGCNQFMDNPPQNQEQDHIVDLPPYLAGDSALLQQQLRKNNQGFEELNMGFEEESEEEMMSCFYFPPSPTYFPLYRPMPTVFFVSTSNIQDISLELELSCQHLLEDKSDALHVINWDIYQLMIAGYTSYVENKFGDLRQTARAAGVLPKVVESWKDRVDECTDEKEVTLRRINWLEQHDEYIVDQPVFEIVGVAQQLIQNRGSELDVIFGGGVFMINGLECRDSQGSPMTPETLLICPFKYSVRVWFGHGGQWAAEARFRCNRLNIGSFTNVEDAISTYELVGRRSGWMDLTGFPGLFENGNRSKLSPQLPPTVQEKKRGEDFGLVCCNATGNDENEAVGTGSEGTGDCVMADQARLNSVCLEKTKTKEKNLGGEKRNQKTNGVRIAIPLENNSLQTKGMRRKDAAKLLKVSITKLKSSCREYGIQRWSPRNEHKLIRQFLPNATPAVVGQEGIPHLTSDTVPSNQALTATVDTNNFFDKEILLPQLLPVAQQENPNVGFDNDEDEAIGMEVAGTMKGVLVEAQLYSRCSEKKGKRKVNTPRGERGNNITTGVRIAITMEDLLKVKGMPLNGAAEHLEVSRSTLKRACREYGIKRWPPRKEHKLISQTHPNKSLAKLELISQTRPNESPTVEHELISQTCPNESLAIEHELINQTRPNESLTLITQTRRNESPAVEHELISQTCPNKSPAVVVDQEQTPQLNPDTFLPSNQVSTTIDTKSVKLKARYEGSTIVFRLSWPLRKVELEQEVKKRLSLEAGTYNINYKDEDGDLVLIACDEDLEECISSSSPLGSRCHELFLKPK